MKLLWRVIKPIFLKYYRQEQKRPTASLEYAFTDHNGFKYYRYPDQLNMPLERFNKLQEYLMWMSARLTGEQLDKMCDKALQLISEGVKKGKNAAAVAAIIHEIKDRGERIIPHELILNMLAVQYIREDERPEVFDNEIQLDKVTAFKHDSLLADSFFLTMPELKKLTGLTNISGEDWREYLEQSKIQAESIKRALAIYSRKG